MSALRLVAVLLAASSLSACGGGADVSLATATPTASPSALPSTAPTAQPSPKLELPLLLLDVRAGPGASLPGTIPPSPGGSQWRGPETLFVDDAGRVWLFDQAKSRVIAYDNGAFVRAIPVPDAVRGAAGLLLHGGRIYLRSVDDRGAGQAEFELDGTTGRLLRSANVARGEASIYPYERLVIGWIPETAKGVDDVLGQDGFGNRYMRHAFAQWSAGQCFFVIRRITPRGEDVAEACFGVGSYARDYLVAPDGAVYQLEQLYTGSVPDRFAVTRVMSPAR